MKSAASILSLLALFAVHAHAQPEIPVADQETVRILADLGVVQDTLPSSWGQLRTDIKGGNPMQMIVPGGMTLWRPDSVQSLSVPDGAVPAETSIDIELNGVVVTLRLYPQPLQEHDPIVMVMLPDGSLERYHQLPSNLYVGDVDRFPLSWVSASLRNGKLRALVRLAPGVEWEIQPLSDLTSGGDPTLHMAWDSSKPVPGPVGRCGVKDSPEQPNNQLPVHDHDEVPQKQPGHTRATTNNQMIDESGGQPGGSGGGGGVGGYGDWTPRATGNSLLAVDVDCYLYDNYNNVQDTIDFVYELINATNARYQQRFAFVHLVTHILVRTSCNNDPYVTSNPDDATQILNRMRDSVWSASNPVPRDIAILFTGRNLDGFIAGMAFEGGACVGANGGQALIEADFSPQSQVRYTLSKHELGHSWDASHTCDDFGNSGYCSVMCASIDEFICGSTNSDFMPASINQIHAFRATAICNTHQGDTWYVDARNPYFYPNGNQNHPFTSFIEAYNNASDSQTVFLRGYGTQNQYVNGFTRLVRPMTITGTAVTGPARIR